MKKIIYFLAITLSISIHAQSGFKHLNIDTGINIEGNLSHNLALEINKGSFSAWEIAIEVHISDGTAIDSIPIPSTDLKQAITIPKNEEMFLAGVYYKPLISKSRNMVYNFRYGLVLGTSEGFVMGAGAGFEATYHLPKLIGIFIKQSNHYIINIDNRFRHSIHAGIKIPF